MKLVINLGGEGEEPGAINQQGPWLLGSNWRCSRDGRTFAELVATGDAYLICPNHPLPFPDSSVDAVITNSVPIDVTTYVGLGVQSSEIQRILTTGGEWIRDGVVTFTKP